MIYPGSFRFFYSLLNETVGGQPYMKAKQKKERYKNGFFRIQGCNVI